VCRISGPEEARIGPYGRKVKRWREVRVRVYEGAAKEMEVGKMIGGVIGGDVYIDDERC
jgi:hypothetical protein